MEDDGMRKAWMKRPEYADRLKFEHGLINRRLGWLLTSESILFAAFAIALERDKLLLKVIAIGGLIISVAILIGVVASQSAKFLTWQDFKKSHGGDSEEFWVRTWITWMAFVPEWVLPMVFAGMWVALLGSRIVR